MGRVKMWVYEVMSTYVIDVIYIHGREGVSTEACVGGMVG